MGYNSKFTGLEIEQLLDKILEGDIDLINYYTKEASDSRYLLTENVSNKVKEVVFTGTSAQFLKGDGSLDSQLYYPNSGGTINGSSRIQGTAIIENVACCSRRFRVNAPDNEGVFGFIDTILFQGTNNVSSVHIGSCYGGNTNMGLISESTDLHGSYGVDMTAISMYRKSVGIGRRWSDTELRALYEAGIKLGVDGNMSVTGTITSGGKTVITDISSKQDLITDLQSIREGAAKGATALQSIPDSYKNVQADWNATEGDAFIKNKPTIPAAVTESTITGWGFTKNAGTVTSVVINGVTKTPSSGSVNLGNFLSLDGGAMNTTAVVTNLNADLLDGHSGSAYAKKEDITGFVKVNAESAGVICAKTRLRVNAPDSTNVFAYMDVVKYGTANNIATAHIGCCYGGTSDVTSTGEYPNGQSVTAISMYRGRVGIGRRWTDTEIRALHDANISLGVANNAKIEGDLHVMGHIYVNGTLVH